MNRKVPGSLSDELKSLHHTDFEHLIYDLLVLIGLRNVVWRTPGADGGRDLEGEYLSIDLSDSVVQERWYVECKRYAGTVDWPTVSAKLAYASNQGADFLLIATTGAISPRCWDEIETHNHRRQRPLIRAWPRHVLEKLVSRNKALLVKYGLPHAAEAIRAALWPLALTVSKVCETAYAEEVTGSNPAIAIEYGASLSELLVARLETAEDSLPFAPRPARADRDLYPWCKYDQHMDVSAFDAPGLRATLSAYRFVTRVHEVELVTDKPGELRIVGSAKALGLDRHLTLASLWSNVRWAINAVGELTLSGRVNSASI